MGHQGGSRRTCDTSLFLSSRDFFPLQPDQTDMHLVLNTEYCFTRLQTAPIRHTEDGPTCDISVRTRPRLAAGWAMQALRRLSDSHVQNGNSRCNSLASSVELMHSA